MRTKWKSHIMWTKNHWVNYSVNPSYLISTGYDNNLILTFNPKVSYTRICRVWRCCVDMRLVRWVATTGQVSRWRSHWTSPPTTRWHTFIIINKKENLLSTINLFFLFRIQEKSPPSFLLFCYIILKTLLYILHFTLRCGNWDRMVEYICCFS